MSSMEQDQGQTAEVRHVKEYRITCICKTGPGQAASAISHVGNERDRWLMSCEMVMTHLEMGTAAFYVFDERTGQRSSLGYAKEGGRRPYLFSHIAGCCNAQLWMLNVVTPGCQAFV